jgi:sugar/nucleoside kinase (ribokinase family)
VKLWDVVGVGANSVDYVYCLPQFPQPDSAAAKLRIGRHLVSPGGQTTTALCTCAAMGLRTAYIGTIGSDANGVRMREELTRRGVDISHAQVRDGANPYAVILLDEREGERVVLWDRDPAMRLEPSDVDANAIRNTRLLHVDDVDEEAAIYAAGIAREAGIPVTSDIERVRARTGELVAAVTIPIFAEHVVEALTGEKDFERGLRGVRSRLKPAPTTVCVTLGAGGAMLLAGDTVYRAPGYTVDVADTTGAGDVFRGGFITALLRGDAPEEILRFANAAAAVSCTRLGAIASVPTIADVDAVTTKSAKIAKDTRI